MITIINYGLGNLGSVFNMFKKIGASAEITSDVNVISKAKKILLPGVGAFDSAMEKLSAGELRDVLNQKALVEKIPVLGICLGMQLLSRGSEEGKLKGLDWIPSFTYRFPKTELKIPHMGWNFVSKNSLSPLTENFHAEFKFYFVHSFYVKADNEENSILRTRYGLTFDSGIQKDNIFGFQFHPEKSHKFGMQLFENFAKL